MTLVTHLRGAGKNAYRFDADLDLAGADLRPGMLLDKPPGRPMALSLKGSASRGGTTRVKLDQWSLHVLDDTLSGTASVEMQGEGKRATTTFALDARAPKLDADALLLESESSKAPPPPPADPHRFDGYRGEIHAEVASLVFHKVPWRNLLLDATMQDDLVKVERLSMDAAGGQVRLDGTTVRLGPVEKPWDLKLAVKSLDLAQALTFGGKGKAFAGVFDGNIALAGKGTTLTAVEKTLDGKIDGNLKNGAFLGADLVASVAGPLAKALPFATKALGETGHTPLGENVGISLTVDNGVAKLNKPLTVQLPPGGRHAGRGRGVVRCAGARRHRGAHPRDHQDAHRREGDPVRGHPGGAEPQRPGVGTAESPGWTSSRPRSPSPSSRARAPSRGWSESRTSARPRADCSAVRWGGRARRAPNSRRRQESRRPSPTPRSCGRRRPRTPGSGSRDCSESERTAPRRAGARSGSSPTP